MRLFFSINRHKKCSYSQGVGGFISDIEAGASFPTRLGSLGRSSCPIFLVEIQRFGEEKCLVPEYTAWPLNSRVRLELCGSPE